jgi:hypothetical protein
MTAAAGPSARQPKATARKARRLQLLCTLRRTWQELGRWPTAGEWEFATS